MKKYSSSMLFSLLWINFVLCQDAVCKMYSCFTLMPQFNLYEKSLWPECVLDDYSCSNYKQCNNNEFQCVAEHIRSD